MLFISYKMCNWDRGSSSCGLFSGGGGGGGGGKGGDFLLEPVILLFYYRTVKPLSFS